MICISANAQEDKGWLKLITNIEQFYLILDNNYEYVYEFSTGDSVLVDAGVHRILIVGENFSDYKSTWRIQPDTTTTKKINFYLSEYPQTSYQIIKNRRNVAISTDENSDIFVDSKLVGTNYTEILLNPGLHRLEIKHPEYGNLKTSFMVGSQSLVEIGRYNQDPTPTPAILKILPGASYLANQQYLKAGITYVGLIGLSSLAVQYNNKYEDLDTEYQRYYTQYLTASSPENAIRFREFSLNTLDEMEQTNTKLTLSVVGIAAVYLVSTIDGFRKPKSGYKGPSFYVPDFTVATNPITGESYPTLSFSKSF